MDKKPVTDLVLLPSLELIPLESLPKHRREMLALEQKRRAEALVEANKSIVATSVMMLCTGIFGWGFILGLVHGSLIALWFTGAFGAIMAGLSGAMAKISASQVRAWRQPIPPQLQLDADNEARLTDMANLTNTQILDWNRDVEDAKAKKQGLGGRFLQGLKMRRELLSENIKEVKCFQEGPILPIKPGKPKTNG